MAVNPEMLSPIAIEKKEDFLASPPYGWRLEAATGRMRCEDNSVTVLVDDSKFSGGSTRVELETLSDLNAFRDVVFSKPIVTTAICRKPYYYSKTSHYTQSEGRRDSLTFLTQEYVVLINTRHPQVVQMLNSAFEMAEEYIRAGNVFRVTIGFSESMKVYFINNEHVDREQNDQTYAYNCDIFLTRGVGSPSCADNCFACKNAPQTACWIVCFPIFLVTGVPYIIYKKCIKGLKENEVKRAIPVIYHQGPFQMGFNLFNLLYPPGTTITTVTHTTQPQPGMVMTGY